jgi:hypothetical protein
MLTLTDPQKPAGRWTSLTEAMAGTTDPGQQLEMTRAYWKLAAAVALYRMACDENDLLGTIRDSSGTRRQTSEDLVNVQIRRAQAAAQLEEAAGKLLAAQYELAQRMRLPEGAPLPLPADKPHVGTYNTRFDQIYAAAAAPPAARFAHRTLELRHSQIDQRAAVVRAAHDVLEVEHEFYTQGASDLATLWSAVDNWAQQRRAFLAAVMQYNAQIADYALNVPRGSLAADSLAGLLIKSPVKWSGPPAQPSYVTPATYDQALAGSDIIALPPPPTDLSPAEREPTLAPPRTARQALPAADSEPALLPKDLSPGVEPGAGVSVSPLVGGLPFGPHEVNRQPLPHAAAAAPPADPGLYSALAGAEPAKRAQELANLLNWNRQLSTDAAVPLSLEECLAAAPASARQMAIATYWRARRAMADFQAVVQEIDQLDGAAAAVLKFRDRPRSAESMLYVRYARLDLEAAKTEAQLSLLAEQFTLTQLVHRPLEQPWVLPSTAPHGGGYRLKADAQPHAVADSFAFKRSTVVVPALHATLQEQAETVVLADADRVLVTSAVQSGSTDVQQLLAAIDRQADQTRAFLATLTRYNTEIGDYALVVLPPQSPPGTLVRALVTQTALNEKL